MLEVEIVWGHCYCIIVLTIVLLKVTVYCLMFSHSCEPCASVSPLRIPKTILKQINYKFKSNFQKDGVGGGGGVMKVV